MQLRAVKMSDLRTVIDESLMPGAVFTSLFSGKLPFQIRRLQHPFCIYEVNFDDSKLSVFIVLYLH